MARGRMEDVERVLAIIDEIKGAAEEWLLDECGGKPPWRDSKSPRQSREILGYVFRSAGDVSFTRQLGRDRLVLVDRTGDGPSPAPKVERFVPLAYGQGAGMTELCRPAWIRRLVFTLILAATAFFVAYWTGFRAGHQTGYSSGSRVGSDAAYILREYPVADLILQAHQSGDYASDCDSLKYLIMSIVSPSDWDLVGGRGCVEVQPPSLTLNVFQSDPNHREIEKLLASMRESRVARRSNGQETQ